MNQLHDLLLQCRAGDVLLTGQRGGLSQLITWAGGAQVSHALLVVATGVAVEARDARWDLREEGKGVRLVRLDSLPHLSFHSVVAVRPHREPNAELLRSWAHEVVQHDAPFASVGLTAMAPLLLAAQMEARAHRFGPFSRFAHPFLQRRRRKLAELVADGTHRVICAELVYRGLLSGGVEVDLSVAQFAVAMSELPAPEVTATTPSFRADEGGIDSEVGFNHDVPASRVPSEADLLMRAVASKVLSPAALPRPRWKFLLEAVRSGLRQLDRRAGHDHQGDRVDLVTPADLLRSPNMAHLWAWSATRRPGG